MQLVAVVWNRILDQSVLVVSFYLKSGILHLPNVEAKIAYKVLKFRWVYPLIVRDNTICRLGFWWQANKSFAFASLRIGDSHPICLQSVN